MYFMLSPDAFTNDNFISILNTTSDVDAAILYKTLEFIQLNLGKIFAKFQAPAFEANSMNAFIYQILFKQY